MASPPPPPPPRPRRILTVGDGDLSYSLAVARAYGTDLVQLTASTLLSEVELRSTYSSAERAIKELRERGARVCFGVDATSLQASLRAGLARVEPPTGRDEEERFDAVYFNHPHLGSSELPPTIPPSHHHYHQHHHHWHHSATPPPHHLLPYHSTTPTPAPPPYQP